MDGLLGRDMRDQLNDLGANPLFNIGMGLMQHRYDSSINPYSAMLAGLERSRTGTKVDDEVARAEAQRKAITEYFAQLARGENPYAGYEDQFGSGATPGPIPFAGVPHESKLRDYVNEQVWKYQLGIK